MNPIERFEIDLEHDIDEQYQYQPAEALRGNVLLHLTTPIKIKAIQVQIRGEAAVSWEEEANGGQQQFSAEENYIDVTQNLLESPGTELMTLDRGTHKYPLEFELPSNLPSSFIGKFGSITYVVKATLKEGKRFGLSTMITSEPFLLLRKLDIANDHRLQVKREDNIEKRIVGSLCCFTSGKVTANLKVNKTGHLPGEDIFMDAEIVNTSSRTVKTVNASIVMHSSFHARNKSRQNMQVVNKKRDEWEMTKGEGRRWKGVRLTIPPYIPESRLDGCQIIDIRYELVFRIEVSGGEELRVTVPIIVGTSNGDDEIDRPAVSTNAGTWTQNNLDTAAAQANNNMLTNGDTNNHTEPVDGSDVEMEEIDEEASKFRYPMDPGDTRTNPLFDQEEQPTTP